MRTLEACKPARFLVEAGDDLGSQRRPRFGDRGEEVVGSGAVSCSLEGLALEGTLGGLACGELEVGRVNSSLARTIASRSTSSSVISSA